MPSLFSHTHAQGNCFTVVTSPAISHCFKSLIFTALQRTARFPHKSLLLFYTTCGSDPTLLYLLKRKVLTWSQRFPLSWVRLWQGWNLTFGDWLSQVLRISYQWPYMIAFTCFWAGCCSASIPSTKPIQEMGFLGPCLNLLNHFLWLFLFKLLSSSQLRISTCLLRMLFTAPGQRGHLLP